MKRREHAILVTGAALSREEEFRARKKRYVITMSMRIVLLVGAGLLVQWHLWAALVVAAISIVLPWIAVIMANDGPPKNSKKFRAMHPTESDRQLESSSDTPEQPRMIDGDVAGTQKPQEEDQ